MKPHSVSKCANPACSCSLLRLSEGKLFMFDLRPKTQTFWLCTLCSHRLTLERVSNGSIEVVPFAHPESPAA